MKTRTVQNFRSINRYVLKTRGPRIAGKCLFGIGGDPHPSVNCGPPLLQLMHEPSGERSNTANTVNTSLVEDRCVETHKPFSFRKKAHAGNVSTFLSGATNMRCSVTTHRETFKHLKRSVCSPCHFFPQNCSCQPPSLGGFRNSFKQPCP